MTFCCVYAQNLSMYAQMKINNLEREEVLYPFIYPIYPLYDRNRAPEGEPLELFFQARGPGARQFYPFWVLFMVFCQLLYPLFANLEERYGYVHRRARARVEQRLCSTLAVVQVSMVRDRINL